MYIIPVVLCGGSGTRLWPLSRGLYPKQFADLGHGRTLFKETLLRIAGIQNAGEVVVICNNDHRFYVENDLVECGLQGKIALEPTARNTAPAIALAAHAGLNIAASSTSTDEPLLLIMPSDHSISDAVAFNESVQAAAPLAAAGYIVTFGVKPNAPETGYGYIASGASLAQGGYQVAKFVEKPSLDNAKAMLAQGGYFWNSGIFFVKASVYLQELERFAPDMAAAVRSAWENRHEEKMCIFPQAAAFCAAPANSIDYAIMEQTDKAAVCPMKANWNDLGSWESLYQIGEKDASGNVCVGDVLLEDAHNCYIHGTQRLVVALGVENIAVIETKDAVLVARRDALQKVKHVVERLNVQQRPETRLHPKVFRPWGHYETLSMGKRFQVKRITVNPGKQLSLQLHYHRAEHWVVVSGTAQITNGDSVNMFTENQSTYIPPNTKHRLKNPGRIPLVIIETQSGAYLGEDDIVRFDDDFGRAAE